ncbi:MAG: ROK family protein [Ruminococcaceae bacterium]|nr:ROK family protein [Oscillospiraceae bacterium]
MRYSIGIDLGGTNMKVGVVDLEEKKILISISEPTCAPRGAEEIAADIASMIRRLLADADMTLGDIAWIGAATPGIVKNGTVVSASNLGWDNVPFAMLLERMTGKRVYLANDANAAAYAEACWGVGAGEKNLIAITLGTGVGGGIVMNGAIFDGFNGFAAEIGHMIIDHGGRECSCGKRGCLEAYCSATALIKESRRMLALYPDSMMKALLDKHGEMSGIIPFEAWSGGDYAATSVINDYIDYLAVGISNVINIFQPEVLCIGGGISAQGEALMKPLRDRAARLSFGFAQGKTRIEAAKFKNGAGIIGAALLGTEKKENAIMQIADTVSRGFDILGDVVSIMPFGNGHINDTYIVVTENNGGEENKYILQKINKNVFPRPDLLMKNFASVTEYLSELLLENGGDPERETLRLVKTKEGGDYFVSTDGDYWRMVHYIRDSICYDKVEEPRQFYESAVAFGNFQRMLKDYPADSLYEIIENFHNTPDRYKKLMDAADRDKFERRKEVEADLEFARAREAFCHTLEDAHRAGRLPLRVTHNDTKLNNILFDGNTGKPICVIDLDTIMPGYSVNDFGDSIRFGATTAAEDESDLTKVNFDIELYELYVKGFIEGAKGGLTDAELEMLPIGAIMMTLECGMRFLTDYLQGDTYFKTHRPGQNLDRARNQFKLVSDMEHKLDEMREIVNKYSHMEV